MMGYRAAILWMRDNDDIDWLTNPYYDEPVPSVSAYLIADIYDRTVDEMIADLAREIRKAEGGAK
jgi:hypothetical protein